MEPQISMDNGFTFRTVASLTDQECCDAIDAGLALDEEVRDLAHNACDGTPRSFVECYAVEHFEQFTAWPVVG